MSGLFNDCTIDWFQPLQHQRLVSVAPRFIQPLEIVASQSDFKDHLSESFAYIHERVADGTIDYFAYFTPHSNLSFLECFKKI
jgi:hypothetical protein